LQSEWVGEVDRVPICIPVEVEATREPDGVFLRKTPDRPCVVGPERRKPRRLFSLAASVSQNLVVRTAPRPGRRFSGGSGGARRQLRDQRAGWRATSAILMGSNHGSLPRLSNCVMLDPPSLSGRAHAVTDPDSRTVRDRCGWSSIHADHARHEFDATGCLSCGGVPKVL